MNTITSNRLSPGDRLLLHLERRGRHAVVTASVVEVFPMDMEVEVGPTEPADLRGRYRVPHANLEVVCCPVKRPS